MSLGHTFRRKLRRTLSAVLALFVVAGSTAGFGWVGKHKVHKDAKHQIEQMEDQWRDAQLTSNVPEMSKLLSEDYFGISMTGQVNTKAQQLARMTNRTLVLSKIDLSDRKIKLIGSTAVVTSRAEIEGTSEGAPITGSFRYTRVYQRTPSGQWQITNFEATRLTQPRGHDHHDPPEATPKP